MFFFVGGWECLLSMAWRQGRSPNGDALVFNNIKFFVSFFLFNMCLLLLTHGDCVAGELLSEVRSMKILWCNSGRMNNNADK
jgi:hypothetical protein